MERYEITGLTTLTDTDDAGRIHAFLQSKGVDVQGVSIGWQDGTPTVWVTAGADPAESLTSYVPTLTAEEQERADTLADAQAAIDAISAKSREERTDSEKLLLALALGSDAVTVSGPADDREAR